MVLLAFVEGHAVIFERIFLLFFDNSIFSEFLQKNVHSTRFVTYFCEQVLPNLSSLTTPVEGLDIQLEVRENFCF